MKKILAVILSVLLAFCCMGIVSFAAEQDDANAEAQKSDSYMLALSAETNSAAYEKDEPITLYVSLKNDSERDLTNITLTFNSTEPLNIYRVSGLSKEDVLPAGEEVVITYSVQPEYKTGIAASISNIFQNAWNVFANLFMKITNKHTDDVTFTVGDQEIGLSMQVYGNEAPASEEHDFTKKAPGEDTLKSEATCVAPAYYYYVCADCGAIGNRIYADGEAKGHDFTEKNTALKYKSANATCTEPAKYFYTCSVCGAVGTDTFDVGEARGHNFVTGNTAETYLASPATCTEPASYYKSCSVCGEKSEQTYKSGSAPGHDFTAEIADEEYLSSEATCTEPAKYFISCAACGLASDETFDYGEPNGHDFTKKKATEAHLVSAATCTAKATYVYVCSACGEEGTETYEYGKLAPHQLVKFEKIDATCVDDGMIEYYLCSACGAFFMDADVKNEIAESERVIPATGVHTPGEPQVTVLKEAACVEDGAERVETYCTVCGELISKEENALPQLGGHTPGEPQITTLKEAKCFEGGVENVKVYCTVCGELISDENRNTLQIGKHTPGAAVIETVKDPGCVEDGEAVESYYCSVCGELIMEETFVLPARGGHTSGGPVNTITKEPSCFTDGEQVVTETCTVCGEKLSETTYVLPAFGAHAPVTVNAREPGYLIAGYTGDVVCARCGEQLSTGEQIPTKELDLGISEKISAFVQRIEDILSGFTLPSFSADPDAVC